jgi:hypothetical protein
MVWLVIISGRAFSAGFFFPFFGVERIVGLVGVFMFYI